MIRRHGGPDLVLVVSICVLADVNAGDKLNPIKIAKTVDPAAELRLGRVVLVRHAACGVQHAPNQTTPHIAPLRALWAVEPDQRPNLATGIRALKNCVFGIEIDSAGRGAARPASSPTLRGIVKPPGRRVRRTLAIVPFGMTLVLDCAELKSFHGP